MLIERMSKAMGEQFVKNELIIEENRDIYEYGMELLISTVLSTVMVLGIGIISNRLINTLFLLITFYCIRVFAGGYHAENYRNCFLSFCIGFIIFLFGTESLIKHNVDTEFMIMAIPAALIICRYAPVEDHSKPLNKEERVMYNRKTRISVLFFLFISQSTYLLLRLKEMIYVSVAIICVCIVLGAGVIKNLILDLTR